METLLFIAGALWRRMDGTQIVRMYVKQITLIGLIFMALSVAGVPIVWWLLAMPTVYVALMDGFDDWRKWFMWAHYLRYSVILLPLVILGHITALGFVTYLGLSVVAGTCYPIFYRMPKACFPKMIPYGNNEWFIGGYSTYAELVAGACMIGGLSLLNI